ncbi:MAG: tetratricopeptide repeat protein [Cytophagales bacterium]|nr:tetratricopeptide repeat protein [Cytophagales bacterium]
MKKYSFILLIAFLSTSLLANGPFEKAMGTNVPLVFSSNTPADLTPVINKLNRIGAAEKDRWEPHYYVAFGYLRMSQMMQEAAEKDKYLDLALQSVEQAESILPNDSELEAMRGFIIMIQLTVDPGTRGMTHSPLAMASFQKAVALNPENPRAHYLLGQMQFGTAQFMGGDTSEACASIAKAIELFDQQEASDNPFAPTWGKQDAVGMQTRACGQ